MTKKLNFEKFYVGGPEPLEKDINENLGSKHEDRF